MNRVPSILFLEPPEGGAGASEPDYFADLNLDQLLAPLTAGREEYELRPFFRGPLHDVDMVRYRHEVLRDLDRPDMRASITLFAHALRRRRQYLGLAARLRHPLQRQAWFRDAVELYIDAVRALTDDLTARKLFSRGLQALREHLTDYAASEQFTALVAETRAVKDALAAVRYTVPIEGARVTVARYEGQADYSAQVEEAFARFRQGAAKRYLAKLPDSAEADHVEAQILDRVARLHPDVFRTLADFCERHSDHLDATIARFDREAQFYLAYLDLIEPLRVAGLPFCYPRVSTRSKEVAVEDAFDLALARKLVSTGGTVVGNDVRLEGPERMLVVTGPNNGGKTTFARMVGQLHHLAGLGLIVPGSRARLFLPDQIHTHFEREEDVATLRGKFEDELIRVHEILEGATPNSVIVMNESFSSTTLDDALYVGSQVVRRILELGALGVYVTFVDEIAALSDATVSMVAQIAPEDPARRTFKVLRTPADGLAYAWAIAEKYGLTYERLIARIAP